MNTVIIVKITRQKGTKDIFFDEIKIWQYIESNIQEICKTFNINEIRTPVFEATELFARGVGDDTDVVNKEMYTFLDKGNRSITLRPELTAGVVRAYIENGFGSETSPVKLWYKGNMYRYEKMQKGRYREFSQFGVEIFGSDSNLADIETICVSYELFKKLGLADKIELAINSIGCSECRTKYIQVLKDYLKPNLDQMCDTCKVRYDKNPMRIIDCKEEKCKDKLANVPMITDYLCEDCKNDFESLKNILEKIEIPYVVDKKIVRGLDYYNKTVYEYKSKDLDLAVGGGGRYDKLVSTLGGQDTKAVGFGLGMDRIAILLKEYGLCKNLESSTDLYILVQDTDMSTQARKVVLELRRRGFVTEMDICNRSFKAQLKYADKINAKYVCILGEEEIKNNECVIKNMRQGTQERITFNLDDIINAIN